MRLEIQPFDYYYVDYKGYNEITISFFGEDVAELKFSNKYDPEHIFETFKSKFWAPVIEATLKEFPDA